MKNVFSITMIFLFLLVSFQQALILVHFELNQKSIEADFCVNKNKPELQCHGKCHLKKELEKSDKSDLELKSIGKKIEVFLHSNTEFYIQLQPLFRIKEESFYKEKKLLMTHFEILHPPPNFL
ncbi:hypothetical protein [Flavobacterium agrisoli]|uniref:Uncharacterized protein n=1 Tax=Flavobacterium agrisoli TaxID=2793066 RepID=A0A934PMX3_9FLAO|nr:hypothetical protein [Flavobacterium agrisoli]MBK0370447.1 hypothetical protein [Flavobacterium agrisoli]